MDSCALCRAFDQDFRVIEKNDLAFSIVCRWPLKTGHMIVLPKRHVEILDDLTEQESKEILKMVERMKRMLAEKFSGSPIVVQNSGKYKTQDHIHFHVIPSGGGVRDLFEKFEGIPKLPDVSDEEMGKMRDKILE